MFAFEVARPRAAGNERCASVRLFPPGQTKVTHAHVCTRDQNETHRSTGNAHAEHRRSAASKVVLLETQIGQKNTENVSSSFKLNAELCIAGIAHIIQAIHTILSFPSTYNNKFVLCTIALRTRTLISSHCI